MNLRKDGPWVLRGMIKESGMTQAQLAVKARVAVSTLQKVYAQCEWRELSAEVLERIWKALGCEFGYVVRKDGKEHGFRR